MKNKLFNLLICSSIIVAGSFLNIGYAVTVPSNVDPGLINKDINAQPAFQTKAKSNKAADIDSSKVAPQEMPAVLMSKKFKLNSIKYTGNTVFKTDDLNKISQELIGKDVTLNDINNVANAVTNIYRKQGYLTTRAYVPAQVLKDGVVEIRVVEGTIGNIKVEGAKWVKATYIKNNILKNNDIDKNKIFNVNDLSKSMAEVNSPSYIKGKVTLEKGAEQGQTDIVLDVQDRFPFKFAVGWNNQGQDVVGVQRAGLYTSLDNVTGIGDKLWANNSFASGTYGLDTGYSVPLGYKGDRLTFGYSLSNTNLGKEYKSYDINGKSHNFSTSIIHPIKKGDNYSVDSRIAFDMMHSDTTIFGGSNLNKYEVRALRTGVSANKTDSHGRWFGDFTVSTGIPLLGATENNNHGMPDSKFVKFNTLLTRLQKLPHNCLGIMRLNTQFATSTLLPAEQMQLGGAYTVRGFDQSALLGDNGYVLSFEGRTPIPFLPKTVNVPYWKDKTVAVPLKDSLRLAAFYDQGWTKVIQQDITESHRNFFQSVGVGLRVYVGKYMTANFDLGVPLGRKRYDGQNAVGFHFGLSSDLY